MAISGDALGTGLINNLARPGANITGSTFFLPELNAKRLEIIKEALPQITQVAALSNRDNPVSRPIMPAMKRAAIQMKLALEVSEAQSSSEFKLAFGAMVQSRAEAVVVTEDGEFAPNFKSIAALAVENKLPSIGAQEFAEAGGLIGYGANLIELYYRAAHSSTAY